jgi:hypothetical protein
MWETIKLTSKVPMLVYIPTSGLWGSCISNALKGWSEEAMDGICLSEDASSQVGDNWEAGEKAEGGI